MRTVEVHRASLLRKFKAKTVAELAFIYGLTKNSELISFCFIKESNSSCDLGSIQCALALVFALYIPC